MSFSNAYLFSLLRIGHTYFLGVSCLVAPVLSADIERGFSDVIQPIIRDNCVKCHGRNGKVKGDVNLFELNRAADLLQNLELVQTMIDVLDFEEMPPEEEEPLEAEKRALFIQHLNELLHTQVTTQKVFPPTPIRRMNRFQYNNAVEDLFELKVEVFALPERMLREYGSYFQPIDGRMPASLKAGSRPLGKSQLIDKRLAGVAPFPQDLRAEHGFDNRGDHLTLSPLLLESFLKLSRSIVESKDLNEESCGIWNDFFKAPASIGSTELEIRKRLSDFLTLAFRKPVEDALLKRYADHVLGRIQSGDTFTDGMKSAASAALASPRFLYLYDGIGAGNGSERVTDIELASRLSFFLWGSIPDRALLDLATEGKLSDPYLLNLQVERMMQDKRLKRFCDSFPSQWLQLERIISSVPDPQHYPDFYFGNHRVSTHMMLEPLLLFETVLVENRSILDLIDSDFSYRSELLDSWYMSGSRPQKVPLTVIPFNRVAVADRREGGVITTAAVMTMTANPTRSLPITRGAWLASVIFNDPPEPPPADVPPIEAVEKAAANQNLTLREKFAEHRTREDCAGCHKRIDPLGFALENYGPTGVWRDSYENGHQVESHGTLFRKHPFSNILDFKDAILVERDRFTRAFAKHLLSFSLGRAVAVEDFPSLGLIVAETKAGDYRLQTLMKQIVISDSFNHKSNIHPGGGS